MTSYADLDVSQQETQVCVIDASGAVRWCGKARGEPAAIAAVLRRCLCDSRPRRAPRSLPPFRVSRSWVALSPGGCRDTTDFEAFF